MSPGFLTLAGAFLAFLGGALTAGLDGARAWRVAAGAAVAGLALALALGSGGLGVDVQAEARSAGEPVHSRVVVQRPGTRRQVHPVALRQPVAGSGVALLLMAALGLAGAALSARGQRDRASLVGAALPLAGGLFALATLAGGGGSGRGAEGVRRFLDGFDLAAAHVTGFTVPDGAWTFEVPGLVPVGVLCAAALVTALSAVRPMPPRAANLWPALGAAVATLALAWQILSVGGAPWRPAELGQALAAVLLGTAFALRAHGAWSPALVAAGLLTAALAQGGA